MAEKSKPIKTFKREYTKRQRRFVNCFQGDIRKAAKKSGISYSYAKQLCTKSAYSHVQEKIDEKMEKHAKNCGMDLEWILTRYKWLIECNPKDFYDENDNLKPISQIPDETLFALTMFDSKILKSKSFETDIEKFTTFLNKIKTSDKKAALDSVSEILGHKRRSIFDDPPDDESIKKVTVEFVRKGDVNVES